jgi:hypothetical protein
MLDKDIEFNLPARYVHHRNTMHGCVGRLLARHKKRGCSNLDETTSLWFFMVLV